MELVLTRQEGSQVLVTCDGHHSHTFDLLSLLPDGKKLASPLDDPVAYGTVLFQTLFIPETLARQALDASPERILFVAGDEHIDALPWEYTYGPDGFLVCETHFVRGLSQPRITPPTLDLPLHIIAIPSNPLDKDLSPLNIDGEWMRLQEMIRPLPYQITLNRTRPSTIEQVRNLVANQQHRVIHFMGHGGQHEKEGAFLCFEQENGALAPITAKQFALRVRGTAFLVTLNACVSATPGNTLFSNLAAALVRQNIPYALGMRFSIHDDDARAFSRTFYSDLARGVPVEEALMQARLTLLSSKRPWVIGVPVLYTSLISPASGFACLAGKPTIDEHQPPLDVLALPRAEGTFQGRAQELIELGTLLTSDSPPRLLTIHGGGGQGKTTLAREAVERFAYAWPGGVYATTLENLPERDVFVTNIARFLGIDAATSGDAADLERRVLRNLGEQRTLIVLDNAETLVEAVNENNALALHLVQFLREIVSNTGTCFLATSREFLAWPGEVGLENDLDGLQPDEGAQLFQQSAPQRREDIELALAMDLSRRVAGHPLSLRLLGGTFNQIAPVPLNTFLADCETHLLEAENKYLGEDHRHRTLYACIETSVRYLEPNLQQIFSKLWLFHSPFLSSTAVALFDLQRSSSKAESSPVEQQLYRLWQRGLLSREKVALREGTIEFYRVLPTVRPYIEHYLADKEEIESLQKQFGVVLVPLVRYLYEALNQGGVAAFLALHLRDDLERVIAYLSGETLGNYLLHWGWIVQRLGNRKRGLAFTDRAYEIGQESNQQLMLSALNNMALVYQSIGQPKRALELYEQALPLRREVGDRAGEATTLNNMAAVYQSIGQPKRALELYEQVLPLRREVGDRAGEATTLNNMALVYQDIGQPKRALELYEQALPFTREVGDRAGEAATLNNMAVVYRAAGQPKRALELYEQVLPLRREVGDRAGEATTLNNMAAVYQDIRQPKRALELYEQASPLMQEVGHRVGEAATLSNMAEVYRTTGQPKRALELYEQVLPLTREVGDRAGEATTLNNMAAVYQDIGQPKRALELYEQALPFTREVGDRAGEAATLNGLAYLLTDMEHYDDAYEAFEQSVSISQEIHYPACEVAGLVGIALLLFQHLQRPKDAIRRLEQALAVMAEVGLSHDAAGRTLEKIQAYLDAMHQGNSQATIANTVQTMPQEQLQVIVANTVTVLTNMPNRKAEWRQSISTMLHNAQQREDARRIEAEFFTALLALLDGNEPTLPASHSYVPALQEIQVGILSGGSQEVVDEELPFEAELVPRSIAALLGSPQDRMQHAQYLNTLSGETTDEAFKALLQTIQQVLFGVELSTLGQNLTGVYRQAWEAIVSQLSSS